MPRCVGFRGECDGNSLESVPNSLSVSFIQYDYNPITENKNISRDFYINSAYEFNKDLHSSTSGNVTRKSLEDTNNSRYVTTGNRMQTASIS